MLEDVRGIIAEQLGTDLTKVSSPLWSLAPRRCPYARLISATTLSGPAVCPQLPLLATRPVASAVLEASCAVVPQVTSDAKFVDLGADSLDTVRLVIRTHVDGGADRTWHEDTELLLVPRQRRSSGRTAAGF